MVVVMGWFADGAWSSPPTSQKARKAHHCDRCLGTIRPGSAYLRWCSVDDGRATTVRSHRLCEAYGVGQDEDGWLAADFDWFEVLYSLRVSIPEAWRELNPSVFHDELIALLGGAS